MKHALHGIVAAALMVTVAVAAPPEEKLAARVDCFGDPLPDGALARLGTVRWRARCAHCLAFSADGKLLVTGNSDMTARVWDVATGHEVVRIRGNELGQVWHVALSPDGDTLATRDLDHGIHLWDARTGKHLRVVEGYKEMAGMGLPFVFTFAADSRTLFVGKPGSMGAVAVAEGKTVPQPAPPENGLSVVDVAPDGAMAVSAGEGGRLVVWDLRSCKAVAEVTGPKSGWVALSPDGKRLAVASDKQDEPTVVVWDLDTAKEQCRCKGHLGDITSLAFAPDGKSLAAGSRDLTARLWDAASGKEQWSYRGNRVNFYWVSVAFSPDGKTVGVAGWDGIVRTLDARTGKERTPSTGHCGWLWSLVVATDGKTAFIGAEDDSIRLWDVATGKEVRTLKPPTADAYEPKLRRVVHANRVGLLDVLPDGKSLLVAEAGNIRRLDLTNPGYPASMDLVEKSGTAALAPDGKTLATLRDKLRLVDVETQKVLCESRVPGGQFLCYSADGRSLAAGGQRDVVHVYDAGTLRELSVLDGGGKLAIEKMALSPDGQLLAWCGQDESVSVWEVASRQLRRRIECPKVQPRSLAFCPDGRFLAFGGWDRVVSIHDLVSGRVVHTFHGHEEQISCLAFTPDGRRLLSGSHDTTVLVWDMQAVPAPKANEVKRTAREMDGLWEQLAGSAKQAEEALRELVASPAATGELLARSLKPVENAGAERIAKLLRGLDDDEFAERQQASADLEKLGDEAVEPLRELLAGKPSAEQKRRAENLLNRLQSKEASPERLRSLRAVQLLEWLGTPEARRTLERLAAGAPEAEQTRLAAGAALARLKKR